MNEKEKTDVIQDKTVATVVTENGLDVTFEVKENRLDALVHRTLTLYFKKASEAAPGELTSVRVFTRVTDKTVREYSERRTMWHADLADVYSYSESGYTTDSQGNRVSNYDNEERRVLLSSTLDPRAVRVIVSTFADMMPGYVIKALAKYLPIEFGLQETY